MLMKYFLNPYFKSMNRKLKIEIRDKDRPVVLPLAKGQLVIKKSEGPRTLTEGKDLTTNEFENLLKWGQDNLRWRARQI